MADNEQDDVPIVVNDSKLLAQLKQAAVYLGIILTAYPTIMQFVSNRDIAGFVNYVRGDQAVQLLSAASFFGLIIWRQFAKRNEVDRTVKIAKASPIAVLKSEVAVDPSLARARETETAAAPAPTMRVMSLADLMRPKADEEAPASVGYAEGVAVEAPKPSAQPAADLDVTELKDAIDAMPQAQYEQCDIPPRGWYCTREKGHPGPCDKLRDVTVSRFPPQQGEL